MIGHETGIAAMIDAETIDMMTGVGMTGMMTGAMMTEAATMTEVAMKTEAAMKTGEVMIGVTTDVMIGVTTGMMIAMKIGEGQTVGTRDPAVVVVCERFRIPRQIECKKDQELPIA